MTQVDDLLALKPLHETDAEVAKLWAKYEQLGVQFSDAEVRDHLFAIGAATALGGDDVCYPRIPFALGQEAVDKYFALQLRAGKMLQERAGALVKRAQARCLAKGAIEEADTPI